MNAHADTAGDHRFLRTLITVMAVILVSGFAMQLAAGRSSFNAPLVVHLHAVAFMGWVAIVVTQAWLAASGAMDRHRLLGKVAVVWAVALLILGPLVTLESVRTGRAPFFFQPQHFLIVNSLGMVCYIAMFAAAVYLRRRVDWHPRVQAGAFVLLMGPGFGRLLPSPLLMPWAFEISAVVPLIFAAVGMARDLKQRGRIHPAWWAPVIVVVLWLGFARVVAFTPAGDALYQAVTIGTVWEGTDGRAFPPPPPMPPVAP